MMKPFLVAVSVTLSLGMADQALAAPFADTAAPTAQATIDDTRSFDFVSTFNHESYRIKILIPRGTPPAGGYPALYVLDGNVLFSTFAAAVRNESQAKERTAAVVVGIESGPGDNAADRTLDFSPTDLSAYEKTVVVDLGDHPTFGGYEKFIQTIQEEIKPKVRQIVAIDPKHETLFGWSLGGQVVVHTMLVHPEYFTGYAALSPSLWRNDRVVLKDIPAFEKALSASGRKVSLFVGVGSLEEQLSPGMKQWDIDVTKLAAEMKYARMVGNVRDFSAQMQPYFAKRGMAFESQIFEGETHNTVPWAAVNPVVSFMLPFGAPK